MACGQASRIKMYWRWLRPWPCALGPCPCVKKKLPKKLPRERERERARVKEFNNTDKGQGAHAGYSSVVERVSPSLD